MFEMLYGNSLTPQWVLTTTFYKENINSQG